MTPDQENQLVRAAVAGDNDALEQLLQHHSPALLARVAGRIDPVFRTVLDAEDVLQVTYVEAFQRMHRFDAERSAAFGAWLGRIAENNLVDAIRALERVKRPSPRMRMPSRGESTIALYERLMITTTTPSRHAAAAEVSAAVEAAVGRLPADYARVIRLYELEGRSAEQVAADLGRSAGAVYMIRARALDRLREMLGAAADISEFPA